MEKYLLPTYYIDSDHPTVVDFARRNCKENASDMENAVSFYIPSDHELFRAFFKTVRMAASKSRRITGLWIYASIYCASGLFVSIL